jgi:hypothetical protein
MREWEAPTALATESQTLSAVLLELDADEFERPTSCPPWDLKELVVHTAASIGLRQPPHSGTRDTAAERGRLLPSS